MSSLRRRATAGLLGAAMLTGLGIWAAPDPAKADVCAQAGVTVDGSTPQRTGPCITLFPEWNVCYHDWGTIVTVRHDKYVCVIVPDA